MSLGGAPAARGTPFLGGKKQQQKKKQSKKNGNYHKKRGYHEPPGHPLDWLLSPIKGNRRTVWSFN